MVRLNDEPNIPNRAKSTHGTTAEHNSDVRLRHPEYHPPRGDDGLPLGGPDLQGQTPEPGLFDKDSRCAPAGNTACYPLDDFNRTVTPTTYSNSVDGGAWAAGDWWVASISDLAAYSFTDIPLWTRRITSTLGSVSTYAGGSCGAAFEFSGWLEESLWNLYTVPAHPTDLAGLNLGPVTFNAPTGIRGGTVGQAEGAYMVVLSSEPTSIRAGTFVAYLPHSVATTVFIPASLIPAEGGTLYVGIIPNWIANLGDTTCGFSWPWMDGQGNSAKGSLSAYTDTLTWQSWDAASTDWGAGKDSDDTGAWWDGSLPWTVSVTGGTAGIDGDSIYLTVAAGSTETLTAHMDGASVYNPDDADDGSFGDPWSSEIGVNMRARFKLTTAGSLTEAGLRFASFAWHDGRDYITATAHLGDTDKAQGLFISGDDESAYVAKDITEGSWMWVRIDTRSEDFIRGKMWVEQAAFGSGEPAAWDLIIDRSDDTESPTNADQFEMVLSAGNATGADQTIAVDGIWFCGAGDECEIVEDRLGDGDGETTTFNTSQAPKEGSLLVFVDGMYTPIVVTDITKGEFVTADSVPPALYAEIIARYHVDRNPDGD